MKKIHIILLAAFSIRILFIFYFCNLHSENYWEYGEIAKNLINGNGYSLFYFNNGELDYHYNETIKPAESAYMPPGYVYFLLPFLLIKYVVLRNFIIILVQIFISIATIYLIFAMGKRLFTDRIALISSLIVAITPEFIYADYSYTPTVIFHFLVLLLFLVLLKEEKKIYAALITGSIIAFICYFRTEFILFAFMIIIYKLFKKEYKFSITMLLLVILLLMPWTIRNYITFNKFIPLTTSFGINLYRGNNDIGIGDWGDEKMMDEIRQAKQENPEIAMNRIFMKRAVVYVKSNPVKNLENAAIKLYYFLLFNPNDIRTTNLFYRISAVFYLIFFIYGIIKSFSIKKFSYFYIFFIYFAFIIIIFFPMIRYQAMVRIMMTPFCAIGLADFYKRSKKVMNNLLRPMKV